MIRRMVCWVMLLSLALAPSLVSAAGPRLELDPPSWEMGEIYQWTNPSTTIIIRNTGDAPLHIKDVKASCGCTAAVLSDRVVAPGKSGEMKIDFASYNFSGPVNKVVVLSTDDPATPERAVRIKGNIRPDKSAIGSMEPEYIDLGIVAPYETRYFDITIRNKGNAGLTVTGIELPDGFFLDTAYPGKVDPLSGRPVRIGYRPAKNKGPVDGEVKALIAHPGQESLWTRVVGYVGEPARGADSLVVTPTGVTVNPGSASSTYEVAVKNSGREPVLVEDADVSFDGASASVSSHELAPGESGTVVVTVNPSSLKPGARGYLYIRVGVPVTLRSEPVESQPEGPAAK